MAVKLHEGWTKCLSERNKFKLTQPMIQPLIYFCWGTAAWLGEG